MKIRALAQVSSRQLDKQNLGNMPKKDLIRSQTLEEVGQERKRDTARFTNQIKFICLLVKSFRNKHQDLVIMK